MALGSFYSELTIARFTCFLPSQLFYRGLWASRCSKFGFHKPLWDTNSDPIAIKSGDQTVYDYDMVINTIKECLATLQIDYLDLMQIHWPGNAGIKGNKEYMDEHPELRANVKEVVRALNDAKESGLILNIGVCNFGTSDLDEWALAGGPTPVTNQLPYNPLWRAIEREILPRCIKDNIQILCYSSLQQGLLSAKATSPEDIDIGKRRTRLYGPKSWSSEMCRHNDSEIGAATEEEIFNPTTGVLENMRKICAESTSGLKVAETALAWIRDQEGIACVLAGASTVSQVERNAQLLTAPKELLDKFSECTEKLKNLQGPVVDQYAEESRIH